MRPQRGSIVDEVKPASVSFAGEDLSQKRPIVAVVATGELRKIQGKPAKEQGVEIRLDSSDSQELPVAALVAPTETGQLPSGMLAPRAVSQVQSRNTSTLTTKTPLRVDRHRRIDPHEGRTRPHRPQKIS